MLYIKTSNKIYILRNIIKYLRRKIKVYSEILPSLLLNNCMTSHLEGLRQIAHCRSCVAFYKGTTNWVVNLTLYNFCNP